jgi:hypothetical protein
MSFRAPSRVPFRLGLGFTLGLGLATASCVDKDGMSGDTTGDWDDADAVTYAGPDEWTETTPYDASTTIAQDDWDNPDAASYAGPDETETTWWEDTTTGGSGTTAFTDTDATTGSTTDSTTTTGDSESSTTGSSSNEDDWKDADAVTYAGPDETESLSDG